jgi:predicted CoA-binding protein
MSTRTQHAVDEGAARRFLDARHIAVVGASPAPGNFGAVIARALRDQGRDVVVVHPAAEALDAFPVHRDIRDVPGELDGVIVVVPAAASADVVRGCAARGVRRVWLFRGIGSSGAVSDEAVAAAEEAGMEVVPGACPLMFLEPVSWFHRVHRRARRLRGGLVEGAAA